MSIYIAWPSGVGGVSEISNKTTSALWSCVWVWLPYLAFRWVRLLAAIFLKNIYHLFFNTSRRRFSLLSITVNGTLFYSCDTLIQRNKWPVIDSLVLIAPVLKQCRLKVGAHSEISFLHRLESALVSASVIGLLQMYGARNRPIFSCPKAYHLLCNIIRHYLFGKIRITASKKR